MDKIALQKEMDQMLQRLVLHFEYDFEKVANSFTKYCNFLWDLYPNLSSSLILDWKNVYTEDICRARFAMIRYQQEAKLKKVQLKQMEPKSTSKQEELINKLKEINPTQPSSFNVLERSLKQEFEKRYESLRLVLPSTFDPNLKTEQDDTEVEAELQTIQQFIKPATDFEKLLGVDKFQQQLGENDVEFDDQDLSHIPDDLLQKEWENEYLKSKSSSVQLPTPNVTLTIAESSPPRTPNKSNSRSSRRNRIYEHESEDDEN